jgi:hypothetical protein
MVATTRSEGMWSREGGKEGRKKKTSEVVGYSRYRSGEENPCR